MKNLTYERKVCEAKDLIENWHKFEADNASYVDQSNKVNELKRGNEQPFQKLFFKETFFQLGAIQIVYKAFIKQQ